MDARARRALLGVATFVFLSASIAHVADAQVLSYTEFDTGPAEPVLTRGSTGAWDELKREKVQVFQEGGLYKMWYEGHTTAGGQATSKIGYATSSDGLTWTPYAGNPVVNRNSSDQDISVVPQPDGTYWMYIEVNNAYIDLLTSPDGIHWTPSPANPVKSTAASPVVWREGSSWYMLYEHMAGATLDIWLATSNDGITWIDSPGNPVISDTSFTAPDSIVKEGSLYHLYYHTANNGMWHATSTNLTNWSNRQLLNPDLAITSPNVFRTASGELWAYVWYNDGANAASEGSQQYFLRRGTTLRYPLVWALDEGAGTIAHGALDQVHGTLKNGASWTNGAIGGGVSFDGINDYISTMFIQNLPVWTVAVWTRSSAPPANGVTSGPVQREANFQINWNHGDTAFRGAAALRVGGRWYAATFGALEGNRWYHLAATYDGETLRTYRDGVLVASNLSPSGPADAEPKPLLFGRHATRDRYFSGSIDDVRIYDRPLGASEISALMSLGQDGTAPTAPTGLITAVSGQTVNLWWSPASDPESGISQYRIYRGTSSGGSKALLGFVNGSNLSASDTSGAASTTYFYEVRAVNGTGLEGGSSNEAVALTGDVPPVAPNGLTATISGGDDVALDWSDNAEQDLAGYRVYRGDASGGPYAQVGPVLVTSSGYTDADLVQGRTYYYVVSAVDAGGYESSRSGEASATIPVPPGPTTPTWHWRLDEGAGTTAVESSGSGLNGTLLNGTAWTPGTRGTGVTFDGIDDYVATTFAQNLPSWTVSVWVRSPAAPASGVTAGPVQREANFQINWNHGDAPYRGAAAVRVAGRWFAASFGTLNANTWYHLTATYDGDVLRTYRDGVLITSNAAPSGPSDAESKPMTFGRHAARTDRFFAGSIDEVKIFDRALSAEEVAALMTN
jgi:hypothetical protein